MTSILPRLFGIFRASGYEPLTGHSSFHFQNWRTRWNTYETFWVTRDGNVSFLPRSLGTLWGVRQWWSVQSCNLLRCNLERVRFDCFIQSGSGHFECRINAQRLRNNGRQYLQLFVWSSRRISNVDLV